MEEMGGEKGVETGIHMQNEKDILFSFKNKIKHKNKRKINIHRMKKSIIIFKTK